jgi:hypothetical protein
MNNLATKFRNDLAEMIRDVCNKAGLPYGDVPSPVLELASELDEAVEDVIDHPEEYRGDN